MIPRSASLKNWDYMVRYYTSLMQDTIEVSFATAYINNNVLIFMQGHHYCGNTVTNGMDFNLFLVVFIHVLRHYNFLYSN